MVSSICGRVVLPAYGAGPYLPAIVLQPPVSIREMHDGLYTPATYLTYKVFALPFHSYLARSLVLSPLAQGTPSCHREAAPFWQLQHVCWSATSFGFTRLDLLMSCHCLACLVVVSTLPEEGCAVTAPALCACMRPCMQVGLIGVGSGVCACM